MWTDSTRVQHPRKEQRLPNDLTDQEWAVLEPFSSPPSPVRPSAQKAGAKIVEAFLYMLRGGLPWRMMPPGFQPATTAALFLPLARRWHMAIFNQHNFSIIAPTLD